MEQSVMDMRAGPMGRRDALLVLLVGAAVAASPLVATAVGVGEKAPDFTLPSTNGENISLSQCDEDKPGVILDYDDGGNFVAVEILDASKRFTDAHRVEFQMTE